MTTRGLLAALATSTALSLGAHAQPQTQPESSVGLTIYSSADPAGFDPQQFIAQQRMGHDPMFASQVPGFGVVRDRRTLDLTEGVNRVAYTDVAQFIDPTTVSLVDLSNAGRDIEVMQQQFQFDLVSPSKLLDAYLDREISVFVSRGDAVERVTGTLLSNNQGRLVLRTDAGLQIVNASSEVQLGELPDGLLTRPTLIWQVWSPSAGTRPVRTAYQTDGITWRSDYNLVLNDDETQADLGAWVTILNLSGAAYEDADLKLIAGDVQRVQPKNQPMMARGYAMEMAQADRAGFEEKSFFEYHMYTLPRPVTIHENATQQLALFPTKNDVKVQKSLVYYGLPEQARHWFFPDPRTDRDLGTQSNQKVDVYIRFDNEEENNLGIPLPAGKVRVYKADDADGALEFVGEDIIDHTPRGNEVLIKIGQSFDVTGERKQVDFSVDSRNHVMTETIEITLKNAKDQPQDVTIRESLYRWVNWEIVKATHEHEKIDSRTVHFPVTVPAEGQTQVTYQVRYTW